MGNNILLHLISPRLRMTSKLGKELIIIINIGRILLLRTIEWIWINMEMYSGSQLISAFIITIGAGLTIQLSDFTVQTREKQSTN
jgi:hypothetical protein